MAWRRFEITFATCGHTWACLKIFGPKNLIWLQVFALGTWGKYHPALREIIVINEPDLKLWASPRWLFFNGENLRLKRSLHFTIKIFCWSEAGNPSMGTHQWLPWFWRGGSLVVTTFTSCWSFWLAEAWNSWAPALLPWDLECCRCHVTGSQISLRSWLFFHNKRLGKGDPKLLWEAEKVLNLASREDSVRDACGSTVWQCCCNVPATSPTENRQDLRSFFPENQIQQL